MRILSFLFLFIFASNTFVFTQNIDRTFISAKLNANGFVEVFVNDGVYTIKPMSAQIIETAFVPNGEEYKLESHAVVMIPEDSSVKINESKNKVLINTTGIEVTIQKSPFQISYSYNGTEIISEKLGYSKNEDLESIQFNLNKTEVLYGGGARALNMNRRGHRLELYNKAHYGYETHSELMNYCMPLVFSSKMYAIHFDNAPIGFLDFDSKKDNTLTYETISGRKTYQIIVGNSWLDLIDNYTDLTGKQPLPPRWVLGNFASRMGYHSEKETIETVQKFEDEKIPLDAVIIDLYWFGKELQGTMGNLEFYKDSFPTPKKMIANFKKKSVKTILITEPFILSNSKKWKETSEQNLLGKDSLGKPYTYDFYFGNTGIIDIYNPKAKDWFWNIYRDLVIDYGVTGWWGDLGEPEVHPSDLIHATGTADEVHNIYGHDWARLIYEGYQTDFPNERPFILMRAGYSGSQRFGMIPWSGDVNRTWGGLQAQPKIALQMAMQGLAYMHSDLGGFAGANLDNELYTRWMQYGVFQPIYRPHAQEEVPPEPVFWEEKTKALAKQAIELRYKLLSYNYTLAWENNQTGAPLMRSIFFEEPENIEMQSYSKSYLWGNDFLISPILESGLKEQEVYFPKSNTWFDFYSTEKIEGGQTKKVLLYADHIPTYVRAGAFIAMAKSMQTTNDFDASTMDLHYYNDETVAISTGKLYSDDGLTSNAFEKENFELLNFKSKLNKKKLNFEFGRQTGANFVSEIIEINFVIHNIQKEPKRVKINKNKSHFVWSEKDQTLKLVILWNPNKNIKLNIKL